MVAFNSQFTQHPAPSTQHQDLTMPARKPPRVRPGQKITAELYNALIDYVEARANIQAGPGVVVARNDERVLISLDRPGKIELYEGIITAAPTPPDRDGASP